MIAAEAAATGFVIGRPRGRPLIGQTLDYLRDPIGYLTQTARDHGDLVRLRLAHAVVYLISHPTLIDQVLRQRADAMRKDIVTRALGPLVGQGLLTSEGEVWRAQRRLIQPAFGHQAVARYGAAMVALAERMLDEWTEGATIDLHETMTRLTLAIVGKTLFDAEVGGEAEAVGHALEQVMRFYLGPGKWFPTLRYAPLPAANAYRRAIAEIDRVIYQIIADRRRTQTDRGDLLSRLLAATDETGSRMDDRQLRDECVTLFLAGHETTALALTYALTLVARHPEVGERLRLEVRDVLGNRPPEAGDVPRLTYTEAVIRESMRLYPPAWGIAREAIAEVEIGGHRMPPGTQFFAVQWIVHRDPRWFDQPEAFRPERWADDLVRRLPRCAYFPFGEGPRICIGNHFAMMEAVLVLASIVRRFRLEPIDSGPIRVIPSITLRPRDPLRVRVRPLKH
ncbi:MAG: cytochrome P450 [Isosphaeraceae bacterium]|jgi:cytochrome P450|nr:MAG: cytochrome P450 [Isosphaeraceae bacterium]